MAVEYEDIKKFRCKNCIYCEGCLCHRTAEPYLEKYETDWCGEHPEIRRLIESDILKINIGIEEDLVLNEGTHGDQ